MGTTAAGFGETALCGNPELYWAGQFQAAVCDKGLLTGSSEGLRGSAPCACGLSRGFRQWLPGLGHKPTLSGTLAALLLPE